MAGPSAITTARRRSWCLRRNTAVMAAKPSVFARLDGDHATGNCEIFADGFAGATKTPEGAAHRPSGLAVGPDGALYVSDDIRGRIYRIVYHGDPGNRAAVGTPCPGASASAG